MRGAPTTSVITIDGHAIEYRLERRGHATVWILHGGHMSARCRFGEETFLEADYSVLVTSRPGYGRTAVSAGPSAPEFAVRLAGLCRLLGLADLTVVGISLGARLAMTLAAFYPELVQRVILMCPLAFFRGRIPGGAGSRTRHLHRESNVRPGAHCTICCARPPRNTWPAFLGTSPRSMAK
jgi:pimeloyl-ACP methyl ester carboxylesterase